MTRLPQLGDEGATVAISMIKGVNKVAASKVPNEAFPFGVKGTVRYYAPRGRHRAPHHDHIYKTNHRHAWTVAFAAKLQTTLPWTEPMDVQEVMHLSSLCAIMW